MRTLDAKNKRLLALYIKSVTPDSPPKAQNGLYFVLFAVMAVLVSLFSLIALNASLVRLGGM